MLKIALIGSGAIGSAVLEMLAHDEDIALVALVASPRGVDAARALSRRFAPNASVVTQLSQLAPPGAVDLVVEVAGHRAIDEHVLPALRAGTACLVASVGALASDGAAEALEAAARAGATQCQLVSGAIGAIDALAAARAGGLKQVTYSGRKPPGAWRGTPADAAFDLAALTQATEIFSGSARQAALLYPKNANVAATVALAGLGLDQTLVQLIADPAVQSNQHMVEARGAFGQLQLIMHNEPLPTNPKTSALTVYSVVRAIRDRVRPLRM